MDMGRSRKRNCDSGRAGPLTLWGARSSESPTPSLPTRHTARRTITRTECTTHGASPAHPALASAFGWSARLTVVPKGESMTSRRRRLRGSRVFALYVLASLVPISVIGAVLVRGYTDAGLQRGVDQGRAQAAVIEQMAIAPALRGADLSEGLNSDERERLQSATDLAIFKGSVSHLRLRSFTGTVEFSDDGSAQGAVPVKLR